MTEQPDISALADAVRESGIGLKPGDVLAVRLPSAINGREVHLANEYAKRIEAETDIKVAFIPGEEFAHTTVNVHVTMNGSDAAQISEEVKRQLDTYVRRRGGSRF